MCKRILNMKATQTLTMGNLRFDSKVKHMLGNNPFKGQKKLLSDVENDVKQSVAFKKMGEHFEYLPKMFDARNGTMFFKPNFDKTSVYGVYTTGQLRKYNLNSEGTIANYQGSRLTTLDATAIIESAMHLFNEDEKSTAIYVLKDVYERAMLHLLQKARDKKLAGTYQIKAKNFTKIKQDMFEDICMTYRLMKDTREMTVKQMLNSMHILERRFFVKCKVASDDLAITTKVNMNTYLEKDIFAEVIACYPTPMVVQGDISQNKAIAQKKMITFVLDFKGFADIEKYNLLIEEQYKEWHNDNGATEAGCTNGYESFSFSEDTNLSDIFEIFFK